MKNTELEDVINKIPAQSDYPNSELRISIPTTSSIKPAEAIEIVHDYAIPKGWEVEDISIYKKSGYISCEECKRRIHVHIGRDRDDIICLNCDGDSISYSKANVSVKNK